MNLVVPTQFNCDIFGFVKTNYISNSLFLREHLVSVPFFYFVVVVETFGAHADFILTISLNHDMN